MKIKLTPNISNYSTKKIGFIIHGTLGKAEGAINWLCTPPNLRPDGSQSSAHYVISKTGDITKLADNDKVTWHAGRIDKPTWRARKYLPTVSGIPMIAPFKNPNDSFIGIELEWFLGDTITNEQYNSIVQIIKESGIVNPIVLCHKEVTSYKSDFQDKAGNIDMLPVQEILRRI